MKRLARTLCLASGLLAAAPLYAAELEQEAEEVVLAVDRLHVGDGEVVENALVTIQDGKVRAVGSGAAPEGAIHVEGAELTPGLIDAYSYMGVGSNTVDNSDEVTPSVSMALVADLDSPAFARAVEEGVTAAYLTPDSLNLFGGLGAVVKTAGGASADLFAEEGAAARVVRADAGLKITLGVDASSGNQPPWGQRATAYRFRRPTTRMGSVWIIRREFYRAAEYAEARARGEAGPDADLDALAAALRGEIPVRMQARRSYDIETALRLQSEFGWPLLMIEEGSEAHRMAMQLAARNVPVLSGPLYDVGSRSLVRGRSLEEWRRAIDPPDSCCGDLGDAELPEAYRIVDTTGLVHVHGLALDLLSTVLPEDESATGMFRGRPFEGSEATPAMPALLDRAGAVFAFGAAEAHDSSSTEASVIHQARTAVRYGLDPARAIQSVTSTAAALCGVADSMGTVAAGRDADLVLWSGPPLSAESRPILVMVDGRIVLDHRASITF